MSSLDKTFRLLYNSENYNFLEIKEKINFSSEIKAVLKRCLVNADFDEDANNEYSGIRFVRRLNTFFNNIYQVGLAQII